jgi:hypothetical protein
MLTHRSQYLCSVHRKIWESNRSNWKWKLQIKRVEMIEFSSKSDLQLFIICIVNNLLYDIFLGQNWGNCGASDFSAVKKFLENF